MFCKHCGNQIDNDAVYCTNCGKNQTITENNATYRAAPKADKNYQENNQKRPSISVNFSQAIKNYYTKCFDFNGRAVKSEFWWVYLFLTLSYLALYLLSSSTENPEIITILYLGISLPSFSLMARRYHDIGKSGWNILLHALPIVGTFIAIYYMCQNSSFSDNQWGLSPYNTSPEYDETKTWKCEKCGERTPNSKLTCKNCGAVKPSPKPHTYTPPVEEQSKKCVCGERVFGSRCPNCGREM